MRNKIILTMVFAGILLLLSPGVVTGESPWPMIRHDAQHSGRSPYPGPERPALKWKRKGRQENWIAVDTHGTIYLKSDTGSSPGRIIALNPDGSLKWESDFDVRECAGLSIATDGNMYLTSEEAFVALDPNGHTRWQRKMKPQDEDLRLVISSPCVVEGDVYVVVGVGTSRRGVFGSKEISDGKIYAFTLDGDVKWQFPLALPFLLGNPTPAVGEDGTIYVASMDKGEVPSVRALSPDGKLKWRYELSKERLLDWVVEQSLDEMKRSMPDIPRVSRDFSKDQSIVQQIRQAMAMGMGMATPEIQTREDAPPLAVAEDETVYFVIQPGAGPGEFLCAVDSTGLLKWKVCRADDAYLSHCSVPAIGPDGALYVCSSVDSSDIVYSFNSNGEFKWAFHQQEEIDTPLIVDRTGTVYFVDHKGVVYALNPDGTLKWRYYTDQPKGAYLIFGFIAIGPERMLYFAGIFGNGDDVLYAIGEAE